MTPLEIIERGRMIRSELDSAYVVRCEFAPGNATMYDLLFVPGVEVNMQHTTDPEGRMLFAGNRMEDVTVCKVNGTVRWATRLPLLPPAVPLYVDPGYFMQDTGVTSFGDAIPLGLLLSAVGGCSNDVLLVSPYIDPDDPERLARPGVHGVG